MDSDTKTPPGRTSEEEVTSVLGYIKDRLRPILLRKWQRSRANLVAEAMQDGMTDEELRIFLRGVKVGYWTGAVDVSSLKPSDLRQDLASASESKVH